MKKLLLAILLFLPFLANAAQRYVRPSATGAANGTDWNNAWSMAELNSNQASLVAGDVIWFAGGTYTTGLRINKGGAVGNPITYKRVRSIDAVPVAAAGWSASFDSQVIIAPATTTPIQWIGADGVGSNIVIDGNGIDSGIKAQMANIGGNYLGIVDFTNGGGNTANITLRYLDLSGPATNNNGFNFAGYNAPLSFRKNGGNNGRGGQSNFAWFDNILVSHCRLHGTPEGFVGVNINGIVFEYCEFYHNQVSNAMHPNQMEIFSITNMVIRYCLFRDLVAAIKPFSTDINITIYGSVWYNTERGIEADAWARPSYGPIVVVNNTIYSSSTGGPGWDWFDNSTEPYSAGSMSKNNIFYNWDPGVGNTPNASGTVIQSDYNWMNRSTGGAGGYGANSINGTGTNPFVNAASGDMRIVSTIGATYPRNKGTNLGAPFNVDPNGVIRGADGTWDIGAFEFDAGTGDPFPVITSATINAAGTQLTIVFSETVTVGVGGSGGFSISMSGGSATLGTPSGSGTTRTYPITGRVIGTGETGSISYTQPGNGYEDSALQDMVSFTGTPITNNSTVPTAAAPSFSPVAGSYFGTQNIVMTSSTPGATIRYTTDGSDPTATSTQYTAGATGIPTSIGTTYRAKAFAATFLDSAITQAIYELGTWVTASTAWKSFAVPSQAATFTWTFRASSSTTTADGIIGLSPNLPTAPTDLAPIIRFNTSGVIDARNGATYAAVTPFTYVAGTTYEIVCTINVASRTYSATAAQIGGSPVAIATNYAFRSDSPTGALDNFGMNSFTGTGILTVSQMSFGTVTGTIPALTSATIGASGTNLTLGFDVPVTYGTGGNGGWTLSASGGAATLTPSASPTSFTISRAIAIGENVTVSYVQPGNGVEATTGGGDMLSRSAFGVNNQSTVDLVAPTPNPSTFSIVPTATGTTTITMTATTSTDANSGPVQYFFNETSGNAGGSDSGWQSSPTFTDTGLAAGTQYTYRVRTRDSASTPNMTSFSSSASATTQSVAGAHPASPFNVARANIVTP